MCFVRAPEDLLRLACMNIHVGMIGATSFWDSPLVSHGKHRVVFLAGLEGSANIFDK